MKEILLFIWGIVIVLIAFREFIKIYFNLLTLWEHKHNPDKYYPYKEDIVFNTETKMIEGDRRIILPFETHLCSLFLHIIFYGMVASFLLS